MPARNDEMQNTMTRVVFVLRPIVATAVGDSDIPCSIRPIRARRITTTASDTTTTNARTT